MNVFSTTRKRSTVKSRPSLPSYTRSINVVFQGNPRNVFLKLVGSVEENQGNWKERRSININAALPYEI